MPGTSTLALQVGLLDDSASGTQDEAALGYSAERQRLFHRFQDRLHVNPALSRQLVSFQANKAAPFYRWFNYKEAFSSRLVRYCLDTFQPRGDAVVLDPFAGVGTVLTEAAGRGLQAIGIELLPVGVACIEARLAAPKVDLSSLTGFIELVQRSDLDVVTREFRHLRITRGAFPEPTERALSAYLTLVDEVAEPNLKRLVAFAGMAVLESVSYTRKDGQYLRWDSRSGRRLRSTFIKPVLRGFKDAILDKLSVIRTDIQVANNANLPDYIQLHIGSCLDLLPSFADESVDLVLTSPPYCNRYDYTRTYALELAYLGFKDEEVSLLRQQLLSATVENKSKMMALKSKFLAAGGCHAFQRAEAAFKEQAALQEVLDRLRDADRDGKLNNRQIPSMIENYFFEMNLVVRELARILKKGGKIIMVNDNVRYNGEEVPVDLILSDLAEQSGLATESIWILPRGKGNSSQQMGGFGRKELRKCVYIWRKA